ERREGHDPDRPESARQSAQELIERYGDLVFSLSVRLTGDRELARDLAQDAFVRILRGASSFRGEASAKTWVCQVVINCHRNRSRWWRRLKRGRTVSLEEKLPGARDDAMNAMNTMTLGATLADPAPGAEQVTQSRETRLRLEQELARLPAQQRAALILRELEGMSYLEIAAALGVREGTVKSRLARARETLRLALSDLAGARPRGETT
ncbi:MAG TPA: sigma-70 family RNA polymerase sigma factor, partial [Ktedonobacterales bacterium]|nr:sigma-70 family RNA polymerase sigma factor [Ktedonobacterales bacterium]